MSLLTIYRGTEAKRAAATTLVPAAGSLIITDEANLYVADGTTTASALTPFSSGGSGSYVPLTRTVNGHALSSNVTVTASDVGAVPTSTTINGHALTGNITLTTTDTGGVPSATTINGHALTSNITLTSTDVSAVPTTRQVNGHNLSADITLTMSDMSGTLPLAQAPTTMLPILVESTPGNYAVRPAWTGPVGWFGTVQPAGGGTTAGGAGAVDGLDYFFKLS